MLFSPNHNAAVTDLQFRLGRQFQLQLEVNKDQCLITSGFRYPSGEQIQILVRPDPQHSAGYIVDDRGEGAAELKDRLGYDSEEPLDGHLNHLFNQTCSRYNTTMDAANGEMETVRAKAGWENLAAVVNQVLQATLLAAFIEE